MRLSQNFSKTGRQVAAEETSKNAQLLIKAGYIHKTMAGVYAYMPLGLRVLNNIENLVRRHMNQIGGREILMNSLHPKDLWVRTGRWDSVDVLFRLQSQTDTEYALAPTHEEQVSPILQSYVSSWKDMPDFGSQVNRLTHYKSYLPFGSGLDPADLQNLNISLQPLGQDLRLLIPRDALPDYLKLLQSKLMPGSMVELLGVKTVFVFKLTDQTVQQYTLSKATATKIWAVGNHLMYPDLPADTFEISATQAEKLIYQDWLGQNPWYANWLTESIEYPLAVYQIQTKFRDELRSKAGLMRGREFRMKDLYDLHRTQKSLDEYYEVIKQTYLDLYQEMGLQAYAVRASGGVFTKFSHEFQVMCPAGEDWTVVWSDGQKDNLEIAKGIAPGTNTVSKGAKIYRPELSTDVQSVADHAKAAGVTSDRILKSILFVTTEPNPRYVAVAMRGDLEVNQELLIQALDCGVRKADLSDLQALGTTRGRLSPVQESRETYQHPILWLYDYSLRQACDMVTGNYVSVDVQRDCPQPDVWGCFATVQVGFARPEDESILVTTVSRSAEVGNIFKLGTRWTKAFEVTYTDQQNQKQYPLMGCHGIGTSRCMGVLAELESDDKGLKWPKSVAPFIYHLVAFQQPKDDPQIQAGISDFAQSFYSLYPDQVLWDDRPDISMGEKLKDADLIGCPWQVIVSKRSLENGGVEIRHRRSGQTRVVSTDQALDIRGLVFELD